MSKVNNIKITYNMVWGLIILAILAFGTIILPLTASAQYDDGSSYVNQTPNLYPIVYSVSPNVGNLGDGPKTVTISGSGFVVNSVARWNGSARSTTFIDPSHLLIQLSAGDLRGSSGRYINVYNPAPGGGYSNAELFTINGYTVPTQNQNTYNNSYDPNSYLYTNTDNNYNYSSTNQNQTQNENNTSESYSSLASNAIFGSGSVMPSGLIQWILFAIVILLIVIIARKLFGGADRYHNTPLKHA